MATSIRFTSADLAVMPQDGKRYEVVDGDLLVSTQPHAYHQAVSFDLGFLLQTWSLPTGLGRVLPTPGIVFSEDNDVVPDLVWLSNQRLADSLDDTGHLRLAPELVVEVVSPGLANERRDRETKRKLYSRRGVDEYWIADWRARSISVFRRQGDALEPVSVLTGLDVLASPVLPGFAVAVEQIFAGIPQSFR